MDILQKLFKAMFGNDNCKLVNVDKGKILFVRNHQESEIIVPVIVNFYRFQNSSVHQDEEDLFLLIF